jgi:hypothetical protein
MSEEIITDWAGNQYPASALNGQETPGFDVQGAKRDRAMQALPGIIKEATKDQPRVGDKIKVVGGRKHKGKEGVVFWRGNAKTYGRRYGSDLQQVMSDALGHRARLGVKSADGEKFFLPMSQCEKA